LVPSFTDLQHAATKLHNDLNFKLDHIIKELKRMSAQFDALTAQVTANNNLLASAVQLIDGIAAQITAAGVDPAKLSALTASLQSEDQALATAILANTPVVVEGAAWVATDIYGIGDTVLFTDGNTYSSLVAQNVGNSPATSPTFWTLVPVVVVPAPAVKAS
jgi:hypothetical protein